MQVLNKTTSVQRLPDGLGNHITIQPGHTEKTPNDNVFRPGVNDVPKIMMDRVKECLGADRWANYAQNIIVEGDDIAPPPPPKELKEFSAAELIDIVKKTSEDKRLISMINSENAREEPRKTVTDAIERRMVALSKKKAKEDGEHDKE